MRVKLVEQDPNDESASVLLEKIAKSKKNIKSTKNKWGKNISMSESNAMVQKLWNFATVLRDDGISYGDYVEQLI